MLRRMAHRCEQGRFRGRHRDDCGSDVHALSFGAECRRFDAPAPILHRCVLAAALLEEVAPAEYLAVDTGLYRWHCARQPDFKGYFRRSSEKGHRRHSVSVRAVRIGASLLATAHRKRDIEFGIRLLSLQSVARICRRCAYRHLHDTRAHGGTRRCHVSPPATLRQYDVCCDDNCHLLFAELRQNPVLCTT